jgi:hypothetical protein
MSLAVSSADVSRSPCPLCTLSVFRVEEVSFEGSFWHKSCFKCGGSGDLGCQRRLDPNDAHMHALNPYCK